MIDKIYYKENGNKLVIVVLQTKSGGISETSIYTNPIPVQCPECGGEGVVDIGHDLPYGTAGPQCGFCEGTGYMSMETYKGYLTHVCNAHLTDKLEIVDRSKSFRDHLDRVAAEVETWPDWKKNSMTFPDTYGVDVGHN